jgi:hypothetical protein
MTDSAAGQPYGRLASGGVTVLGREEWESVSDSFDVVLSLDTMVSGMIILLRYEGGFAVVEEPGPGERVLRGFDDEASARRFVEERMDTYERMWDGCGCRIDYYG